MNKTKLLAAVCCTAMLFAACEKPKEAIDLGLSVKWAACNLGATKPEEYGNYYAWGETTTKSEYTWNTCKYGSNYGAFTKYGFNHRVFTKYCTDSNYGTVDNKTTLEAADDAATQNWGANWRMPTISEWKELVEKCTWRWTTKNSVKGYEVKASNGNSIFLPAAGCRFIYESYDADSIGFYWSSSLGTGYPSYAQSVGFNSNNYDTYDYGRLCGLSVRPVLK
jgi:hypothetical protein